MRTILQTPRLVLREMTEDDAEHLLALSTPNVLRFVPGEPPVHNRDDALAVLRDRVFPQYALGLGRWACVERASGAFVGWSGIKLIDGEYDVGYRFLESAWGKGYASESAHAVCGFARERLRGKRVVGKAMHANVASKRVLEKAGLVYEGEETIAEHVFAVYVLRV